MNALPGSDFQSSPLAIFPSRLRSDQSQSWATHVPTGGSSAFHGDQRVRVGDGQVAPCGAAADVVMAEHEEGVVDEFLGVGGRSRLMTQW